MRPAGGNFMTLRKYAERVWQISTAHFDANAARRAARQRGVIPLHEVLVDGSTYARHHVKRRLFAEGIKERRCELCGQGQIWRGRQLSLILDHVNGVADDNRLENLQIVCPNCAATLDTHCGRNNPRPAPRPCLHCGAKFEPRAGTQRYCSSACGQRHQTRRNDPRPDRRVVDRPPYQQLLTDVKQLGYLATGRRYGVSDNAIRKWIRAYEQASAAPAGDGAGSAMDGA
jgi:hypothetical protein